jgi:transketolase
MSVAVGAAQAKRLNGDENLVYCLHGDGELQEGQIWESAMYAGAKSVDNLIATIDANGQQIDGSIDDVLAMGDIASKFTAFGWAVMHIHEGNDMAAVVHGLHAAKGMTGKGKPVCVIMHTDMGHGVDFMAGTHKWHGIPPSDEQLADALSQLPETLTDYTA